MTRLAKSSKIQGTWDLMKVCKGFLEEWVKGSKKARDRQETRQKEIDKNERFKIIELKKK